MTNNYVVVLSCMQERNADDELSGEEKPRSGDAGREGNMTNTEWQKRTAMVGEAQANAQPS